MEPDTIAIIGMWISIVGMILWQSYTLNNKIDTKIDALDTKMDNEFRATRRDIATQDRRLARIEGHLLGLQSPGDQGTDDVSGEPPPEDR